MLSLCDWGPYPNHSYVCCMLSMNLRYMYVCPSWHYRNVSPTM